MSEDCRLLVIVFPASQHVYRWRPGSEGTLLAALLQATRDPQHPLTWAALLPILVRLRDLVLDGDGELVVRV